MTDQTRPTITFNDGGHTPLTDITFKPDRQHGSLTVSNVCFVDHNGTVVTATSEPIFKGSFVKSNGSIASRIYERLTKRSRRNNEKAEGFFEAEEHAYRRGVYDALKALQEELKQS